MAKKNRSNNKKQAKAKSSNKKPDAKTALKKEAAKSDAPPRRKKESVMQYAIVLIIILAIQFVVFAFLIPRDQAPPEENEATQTTESSYDGRLQVLPAIDDQPQVPDLNLQGSQASENQQAAGDLQTPRRANDLQPSAGLESLPEDFNF